ncbi:MAG: hypothetical protein MUE44_09385 [Oscillatoriaceae cyanobacterium Prado104]|nr:hypothetical protein [Oscillatoriaceae cyanobacterium Prado104]
MRKKKEEGRRKKEEGRRKKEEGRRVSSKSDLNTFWLYSSTCSTTVLIVLLITKLLLALVTRLCLVAQSLCLEFSHAILRLNKNTDRIMHSSSS